MSQNIPITHKDLAPHTLTWWVLCGGLFFAPAAPPERKQLEKAGFTHIYGGGVMWQPFEAPTEAFPRWEF